MSFGRAWQGIPLCELVNPGENVKHQASNTLPLLPYLPKKPSNEGCIKCNLCSVRVKCAARKQHERHTDGARVVALQPPCDCGALEVGGRGQYGRGAGGPLGKQGLLFGVRKTDDNMGGEKRVVGFASAFPHLHLPKSPEMEVILGSMRKQEGGVAVGLKLDIPQPQILHLNKFSSHSTQGGLNDRGANNSECIPLKRG